MVDIPTEAVAEVRGPDELRLLIFPQPLDGALKNQNAAPSLASLFPPQAAVGSAAVRVLYRPALT